jgi:ornithine--oxo-acid transaminase
VPPACVCTTKQVYLCLIGFCGTWRFKSFALNDEIMAKTVTIHPQPVQQITMKLGSDDDNLPYFDLHKRISSEELMKMEKKHGAHNYHPLPVVFQKALGVYVWDPEGRRYYDFLSAYSALNQGHCHPRIIQALKDQAERLTLSSRAFYNDVFPRFAKYVTEYLGYEMVLPMNGGAEAVETAMKLARKWGYTKKGIPQYEGIIICCKGCFHGRTIGIISMSSDPQARDGFGPYLPGLIQVEYNNVNSLKDVLEQHGKKVCAFLVEPIQGEAGVIVPSEGYLKQCYELCKQHNVLFVADEIQTGLGRTGKLLASQWEGVRPDIVIIGKALSGGVLPMSAVLADSDIMLCIQPGEHGSTYGGNPLASAVAIAALEVIKNEKLVDRAQTLGAKLLTFLQKLKDEYPFIKEVRGRGLLCAIDVDEKYPKSAWDICIEFKKRGLLAKPTHDHVIRLAPPLIITDEQLEECMKIIEVSLKEIKNMKDGPKKTSDHHDG